MGCKSPWQSRALLQSTTHVIMTDVGLREHGAATGRLRESRSGEHPKNEGARAMKRFENQVVLITGGNAGMGRASGLAFAREGAKVVVAGRREVEVWKW